MTLTPYLYFNGRAEEAFTFYHKIFGGSIEMLSRYADMPNEYPADHQNQIMHARLIFGDSMIMFSDVMPTPGREFKHGDEFSMAIGFEKEEEKATGIFDHLAEGGTVTMPLQKQFWGALYGQVTDKFGIQWMVNCNL